MILSYDKKCSFDVNNTGLKFDEGSALSNSMSCLAGVFDWNGSSKPNKLGEDILTIGLAAGLGTDCAIEVNGKCFTAPFIAATPLTYAECEAEKDKLGIKYCNYDQDYWAGAVKQCGGVNKMPTQADLTELVKVLYNTSSINSSGGTHGLTLDTSKASSMGFTGDHFYVWSGEEVNSGWVDYRTFYSSYTYRVHTYRNDSGVQAVCLGE